MNWLLWKDYRNNRLVVFAALFFLLAPHLVALYACCREVMRGNCGTRLWIGNFATSSIFSLIISQLLIALIAGNAIAGERADRSAEFLASLPITRKKILASKLLLSLAIVAVIWLTDASALMWLLSLLPKATEPFPEMLGLIAVTAAVFFSVGWCLSSFLASPTFAVAGALLTPLLLGGALLYGGLLFQCIEEPWYGDFIEVSYCAICLVLAPVCFGVGTWYYLRRVEP